MTATSLSSTWASQPESLRAAGHVPMGSPGGTSAPAATRLDMFRALGDASRLRMVMLLRQVELAVGELAQLLNQSQPRVSRHLKILEDSGLVERRKEGSWVFVRMVKSPGVDALCTLLDDLPMTAAEAALHDGDRQRLAAVQSERDMAAARYFALHAAEWDGIRSLYVAEEEVERAILDILGKRRLGHLVDVGTGTGRMAAILGPLATRVTAIDRSPEMLRIARSRLAAGPLPVELMLGDFLQLPFGAASIDSIVMHQVLHYATAPGAVIAEAARVLRPSGHLLIVDFAPHDREELRKDAAHARLGFSDGQLRGWFASTGLVMETIDALSGGPLTVKIWLGRRSSSLPNDDRTAATGIRT